MRRRVVITGLGTLNACGNDAETAWKAIVEGKSGVGRITRYDPNSNELWIINIYEPTSRA